MDKYTLLDKSILEKLTVAPEKGEPKLATPTFSTLFSGAIVKECVRIAAEEGKGQDSFRILDRRLQAMRKSGKIISSSRGWYRVEAPAESNAA